MANQLSLILYSDFFITQKRIKILLLHILPLILTQGQETAIHVQHPREHTRRPCMQPCSVSDQIRVSEVRMACIEQEGLSILANHSTGCRLQPARDGWSLRAAAISSPFPSLWVEMLYCAKTFKLSRCSYYKRGKGNICLYT